MLERNAGRIGAANHQKGAICLRRRRATKRERRSIAHQQGKIICVAGWRAFLGLALIYSPFFIGAVPCSLLRSDLQRREAVLGRRGDGDGMRPGAVGYLRSAAYCCRLQGVVLRGTPVLLTWRRRRQLTWQPAGWLGSIISRALYLTPYLGRRAAAEDMRVTTGGNAWRTCYQDGGGGRWLRLRWLFLLVLTY